MYISKVKLENFRIFRGKHEFNFDNKKLILIEGPNGHGKSTIFDAINWVISGKINRYIGSSERTNFNYIINNDALKNYIKEATVEITFKSEEQYLNIKRIEKVDTTNKLFINGKEVTLTDGQKMIASLLIKEKNSNEADDSNFSSFNLASFIESTLILSQENLENFVRGDKPMDRFRTIERSLGLTKYGVDFKQYLDEIKNFCNQEYDNKSDELNEVLIQKNLLEQENKMLIDKSELNKEKPKEEIIKNLEKLNQVYNDTDSFNFNKHILIEDKVFFDSVQHDLNNSLVEIDKRKKIFVNLHNKYNNDNLSFDVDEVNKNINEMNNKINIVKRKLYMRENGVKSAYSKKDLMINSHQLNLKLIDFNRKSVENQKNIDDLIENRRKITDKFNINYTNLSTIDYKKRIDDDINIFDDIKNYYQNLLDKEIIFEIEFDIKKIKKLIDENEININYKTKSISDIDNILDKIEKEIISLKEKKHNEEKSNIRSIIHQVQLTLLDSLSDTCEVCGTKFLDEEELNLSIQQQMKKTVKNLSEIDKKVNDFLVLKNMNIKHKNGIQIQINEINVQNEKSKKQLNDISKKLMKLKIEDNIDINDPEMLKVQKENISNIIKANENRYLALIKIRELNEDLKEANLEKMELLKQKEICINYFLDRKIELYLNNNKKVEKRIDNLNLYLNIANEQFKTCNEEINMMLNRIQNYEEKIIQLDKIRIELKNLFMTPLNLDSKEIYKKIYNEIEILNSKYFDIDSLVKDISLYKKNHKLRKNENELLEIKNKEKVLLKLINELKDRQAELIKLSKYHASTQSSLLNEYLISISKEINNYYRQISPHSYNNYVNLKAKDNALYIILQENLDLKKEIENIDVNASLTLSAAQSTVLAMSIFLALNKSQNMSNLNLIGIDDPFQNLDDINSYSFIDLLSNFIYKENRQILISTHDSNFSSLTLKKVDLYSEEISYIKIESYTNEAIEISSAQHTELN